MVDTARGETLVACCQVSLEVGNVEKNLASLESAVRAAADNGAGIVILPELANTGYLFADAEEARSVAENLAGPSIRNWQRLTAELDIVLVAGFAEAGDDGRLYNSAVILEAGELRARYRKVHLWDTEKAIFTPGSEQPPVVTTRLGSLGVMICYDLEFPEWVRSAALRGADLLAAPVNWPLYPRPEAERPSEIVRVQAGASVNRMYIAACDRAGIERGQQWLGGSVIVDPDGFPVSTIELGQPHTALARVSLAESRNKRISARNDVHADRQPTLYGGD